MRRFTLTVLSIMLFAACDINRNPLMHDEPDEEILVYAGINMSGPVEEIRQIVEEGNSCKISVLYGACGYLRKIIEVNKVGDIYLPGESSFVDGLELAGTVSDTISVGYNKLSYFVRKGNQLQIKGAPEQILEKGLRAMIGDGNAGSVGKETKYLYKKLGLYDEVLLKVQGLTADSEGLIHALRDNEADIVLNWLSTGSAGDNSSFVEPVEIDSQYVRYVPVKMGLLKYSVDRDCAERFMNISGSEEGKNIFKKYGFAD